MKNFKQRSSDQVQKDRKLQSPSVTEYMVRDLITFSPDTAIMQVIETLLKYRITGAPVLNEKKQVVGLIDDKDCLNVLVSGAYYNQPVEKDTVKDYMSNVMKSISVNDNIVDVANVFVNSKYKRLLVIDDEGGLVGQISRRDVLRAIKELNTNTW